MRVATWSADGVHAAAKIGVAGALGALITISVAGLGPLGASPISAAPTTLFADSTAVGTGDCATSADACSLTTALSDVAPSGTIELLTPGTTAPYSGGFTVATPGTAAGSPVTIRPAPSVSNPTLDGAKSTTVLTVEAGVFLNISGVTIMNGSSTDYGGGILNYGTTTVSDSTLSANSATQYGGGIANFATTIVSDSTLSGNRARSSGGIFTDGTTTVTDSTLSANSATQYGGGIYTYPGGTTTVTDSTLSGNSAGSSGGGGIDNYSGTTILGATIVANSSTSGGDCAGTITDQGYNISSDGTCGFDGTSSISDSASLDASLGTLQNNGGPANSILPSSTSPAVGVIPDPTTVNAAQVCPRTDQTGASAPLAGQADCTIGAVEMAAPACAAGSFSSTGNGPCTPAPPGTYVGSPGATAATNCPIGTFTANSGATRAADCVLVGVTNPGNQSNDVYTPIAALRSTAANGILPLTWSTHGLPVGLTLDSTTGMITGTPTKPCACSVVLTATDARGHTGTANFTWTILSLVIVTRSLPAAIPGVAYGPVTLQAAGLEVSASPFATTLKWKKDSLPKGLKISRGTGVLYGTPSKKLTGGMTSVQVSVTETVTTLNGKKRVKTKTTVQATISLILI